MSIWIHVINPFEVATAKSRRKMLILISDHTSRLQNGLANPIINDLHVRTVPLKQDFSTKYSRWSQANGAWKGETKRVNADLKLLSGTLIENWDIRIQIIFPQGSPDYLTLLPRQRIPFQQGTMDETIQALQTLGLALAEYPLQPSLVVLRDEVVAFHTVLEGKRNVQQQKEQAVKDASAALEAARIVCAVMMFRNLGILIDTYPTLPNMITNYYQMNLLRDIADNSEEYLGTLLVNEQKNAVSEGITQDSIIYIHNTGDSAIQISIQDNPNMMNDATDITLQPGDDMTTQAGDIPLLTAYFINLRNLSGSAEGAYTIIVY